jgi:predicted exporter
VDVRDGGPASVVMLRGLGRAGLPVMAQLDGFTEGVRFVDRTGDLSRTMARYRQDMLWLLIAGYALVFAALFARFKGKAWRALAPTFISSVLAIAVVGLIGEKVELFHVLALWLLLGMGVDYGIFLLEHPSRQAGEAWLAVGLGAVSTLLSFGLLALSSTPAIHAFGLAMAVGIGAVWAISPLFCDEA